jgi:Asp-tRNA(Asn)/Glu-tRNA(Gln) amidotransferase A subunit family amidase
MTRTVADAAAMLSAVAGEDQFDPTSGRVPVPDYRTLLDQPLSGRQIGVCSTYLDENVSDEVRSAVRSAIALLEAEGAEIIELRLPEPDDVRPALRTIIAAEATAYHLPWLRERPGDYSAAVRERLELGALTPATSYIQAQRMRGRVTAEFAAAMADVDVVAMPTGPTAATPLDGDLVTSDSADEALLAALINFTGPFNLTGFPAVSIPCGFTAGGLPIGLQLASAPYQEARLLSVAHQYELRTEWTRRIPTAIAELI